MKGFIISITFLILVVLFNLLFQIEISIQNTKLFEKGKELICIDNKSDFFQKIYTISKYKGWVINPSTGYFFSSKENLLINPQSCKGVSK